MKRTLAVGFAVSLVCAPLHAQSPIQFPTTAMHDVTSPYPAHQLDAKATVDDMKAALRDLVTAQERYFVDHDAYTTDSLALSVFTATYGHAQTKVTFAGSSGWTGFATEPSLKGKNCVIYVGFLKDLPNGAPKTTGGVVAKEEGVPVCDEP